MSSKDIIRLADLVFQPTTLSKVDVAILEQKLAASPTDLESRLTLIGHSYYIEKSNDWQTHILWLVENSPSERVLSRIGVLLFDVLDEQFYATVVAEWMHQIDIERNSAQILVNTAAFMMISDLPGARKMLEKAKRISPDNPDLKRCFSSLLHHENENVLFESDGDFETS